MKKAVVLEIKEEYAAVLTDEGFVQKIRNENYTVGQEIERDVPNVTLIAAGNKDINAAGKKDRATSGNAIRRWYRAAAAAAAVFVISGSGLYYASENVFAYSTVTVTTEDSSLELTLNKKDEVVGVRALDEKSGETVSEMKISVRSRKSLSDTLDKITEGQEQAEISVTSRNEERKEKIQKEVQEMLPPEMHQNQENTEIPADTPRPIDAPSPSGAEEPVMPEQPGESGTRPEQLNEAAAAPERPDESGTRPEQLNEAAAAPEQPGESETRPEQPDEAVAAPEQPGEPETRPEQSNEAGAAPEQTNEQDNGGMIRNGNVPSETGAVQAPVPESGGPSAEKAEPSQESGTQPIENAKPVPGSGGPSAENAGSATESGVPPAGNAGPGQEMPPGGGTFPQP